MGSLIGIWFLLQYLYAIKRIFIKTNLCILPAAKSSGKQVGKEFWKELTWNDHTYMNTQPVTRKTTRANQLVSVMILFCHLPTCRCKSFKRSQKSYIINIYTYVCIYILDFYMEKRRIYHNSSSSKNYHQNPDQSVIMRSCCELT